MKDPKSAVLRHPDTGKWFAIVMPAPKSYLRTGTEDYEDVATMKCEPFLIDSLVNNKGYYRAYHMNKQQWMGVGLDGSVPLTKILD